LKNIQLSFLFIYFFSLFFLKLVKHDCHIYIYIFHSLIIQKIIEIKNAFWDYWSNLILCSSFINHNSFSEWKKDRFDNVYDEFKANLGFFYSIQEFLQRQN